MFKEDNYLELMIGLNASRGARVGRPIITHCCFTYTKANCSMLRKIKTTLTNNIKKTGRNLYNPTNSWGNIYIFSLSSIMIDFILCNGMPGCFEALRFMVN